MLDRYLFRGKTISGEWAVGAFTEGFDNCYFIQTNCDEHRLPELIKVDPTTICQCTGLRDKTGKLIWENDILSGHIDDEFPEDETRKRVAWYENGWCTNEMGCADYEKLDNFVSENFEVIGNTIDNPELEVQE